VTAVSPVRPATPLSPADLLRDGARRLAAAGIDTAMLDARVLLMHALGISREDLAVGRGDATKAARDRFDRLIARRAAREPLSRLTGSREFWSLPFAVSAATLIPRPDSETVVETALSLVHERDARLRVLDLGTGTGCLLLALLSELPNAWGVGVDVSEAALHTARANAAALELSSRTVFLCTDWESSLSGRFDVVLTNPPYVASGAIAGLEPEVALHEPPRALDGGLDGLDAYRAIAPALPRLLADDGFAVIEVGAMQAAEVAALVSAHDMTVPRTAFDLGGRPRCVVAERGPSMQKRVGEDGPSR
jgi:release factor glutamine methyltransferase